MSLSQHRETRYKSNYIKCKRSETNVYYRVTEKIVYLQISWFVHLRDQQKQLRSGGWRPLEGCEAGVKVQFYRT
jgi:hypothetical protein